MAEKLSSEVTHIVEQVEPLISGLPPAKQQEVRQLLITTASSFQGPLPPPEMLEHYGRLIKNGPERLMLLLEKQTDHRINMESKLVRSRIGVTSVGQWMAFLLSLFFGVIALLFAFHGLELLAGLVFTTTITTLAAVFFLGKTPAGSAPETAEKVSTPSSKRKRGGS